MSKVFSSFDLHDYVSEIMSPEVAAQVAQSVAWRVDIMIISAARQLYKGIRQNQFEAGIDVMAELTLSLNMQAYAETAFYENGSTVTGPVCAIKELMYVRESWHGLARELTGMTSDWKGVPKTYIEKTIEEQIFEPGQMKVASQTKNRMMISAKRKAEAYDMPDAADKLYASNIARAEQRNADMGENLKGMAQGVCHMFSLACAHKMDDPSGETTMEFTSLSLEAQRVLINAAKVAAERAEQWAMDDRNLSDNDFDLISLSALKVDKDLRSALKQPRFVAAAAQETAAEANVG